MLRKLAPFQPLIVTATYFNPYLNAPQKINQGKCWQWAYLAHKTFKDVELWDICEHAFVQYHHKFYDSERILGEVEWEDLPAANFGQYGQLCQQCQDCGRPEGSSPLTEIQFRYHWNSQTRKFNTTWADLDRLAQRELRRHGHQA